MGTQFEEDLEADSLDLVEHIMALEESFGIEISEEGPDDWRSGSPVPRRGPHPTLSGGATVPLPSDEEDD